MAESSQNIIPKNPPHDYKIPEIYVRNLQHDSYPTIDPPTIDLNKLLHDHNGSEGQNLHSICKKLGYFQVINHGFEGSFFEKLNGQIKSFYNLPPEEMKKYERQPNEFEGYGNMVKGDGKLDWGDRFFATVNPKSRVKPHLFPQLPPPLRESLNVFREKLEIITMKLLEIMSTCLGINYKEDIESNFRDGYQALRIGFYPPCPHPDAVLGIVPHSDSTCLTVLHQVNGVDGLQVKEDGVWKLLHIHPEAILIFIGDILEVFTNGDYKSVEHRVMVNPKVERFTIILAFNPHLDAELKPLKSKNPLFKPIKMSDYIDGFNIKKSYEKNNLEQLRLKE